MLFGKLPRKVKTIEHVKSCKNITSFALGPCLGGIGIESGIILRKIRNLNDLRRDQEMPRKAAFHFDMLVELM